jgi:hypothetical protein
MDHKFEYLPKKTLAEYLRKFYASARQKDGKLYSKSSLMNIRGGINRHLQSEPYNQIVDISTEMEFMQANKVMNGMIRTILSENKDTAQPHPKITDSDMEKLHQHYFVPHLHSSPYVLQDKVWFDLAYYFARRGKEGLRNLTKDSFQVKKNADGKKYVTMTHNEETKKNKGDESNSMRGEFNVMVEEPGADTCPVYSFELYLQKLHPDCDAFFQTPRADKMNIKEPIWYKKSAVGVNTLGKMMKVISVKAQLSQEYTNHCCRGTSATNLSRSGFNLRQIQAVTHHKRMESLQPYVNKPGLEDKLHMAECLSEFKHGRKPQTPQTPTPQFLQRNFKPGSSTHLYRKEVIDSAPKRRTPSATISTPPAMQHQTEDINSPLWMSSQGNSDSNSNLPEYPEQPLSFPTATQQTEDTDCDFSTPPSTPTKSQRQHQSTLAFSKTLPSPRPTSPQQQQGILAMAEPTISPKPTTSHHSLMPNAHNVQQMFQRIEKNTESGAPNFANAKFNNCTFNFHINK